MDKFSSRKANGALSFSRKAPSALALRDSSEKGDRNTQLCSRASCGSRMNSSKGNQVGSSGKAKTTRHPFRLSNSGKEIVGSSSRTPIAPSGPIKPNSDPRKNLPSHLVADMETSAPSEESGPSERAISPDHAQVRLSTFVHKNVSGEASSSSSVPHSRHGKRTMRRRDLDLHDITLVPAASLTFQHGNHGVRNGASTSKYSLKNLKCNSIKDVVSSGCSSSLSSASDVNLDRNSVMDTKRSDEAQSSLLSRGKKTNGPELDDRRSDRSRSGVSISSSRRTRNSTFTRDNVNDAPSVGIRSAGRGRLNEREDRNRLRQTESSIWTPVQPQPGMSADTNASHSEASSRRMNAPRRPGSSHPNSNSNGPIDPSDADFDSSSLNTENAGHYNLDGIAEMLLALDGIEQDEEPTYEQLLAMETNLFLSNLPFNDQHRDMRLDIDNMSYEELLALEERIGTVSTALTEEALEKCLNRSMYKAATTEEGKGTVVGEGYDMKCCICQEEYEEGNEVGRLGCEHRYHVGCIQQWLRLKNWCPICKASAAPPPSPPPPPHPAS